MKVFILLSLFSPLLCSVPCGTHLPKKVEEPSRPGRHIIGGNNVTTVEKWPWQMFLAAFFGDLQMGCGGTVISDKWILTAAHCLRKESDNGEVIDAENAVVLEKSTAVKIPLENFRRVARIIPHANYKPPPHAPEYDIALLKLEEPISFDESISPICLVNGGQSIPADGYAVTTGYGDANERGTDISISDFQLRETIVPIVKEDVCTERWAPRTAPESRDIWTKNQFICAGAMGHGVGSGDSGGPLMMKAEDGSWFQIGVTSFGRSDSEIEADLIPNVFTDVRKYCDWIKEKTEGEVTCHEKEVTLQDVEIQI